MSSFALPSILPYFTLYLTSTHLTHYLTLCLTSHLTLPYISSPYLILPYVFACLTLHLTLLYLTLTHLTPYVIPYYHTLPYLLPYLTPYVIPLTLPYLIFDAEWGLGANGSTDLR